MREVRKGIYLIGESFDSDKPTLVLVHPWFFGDPWSPQDSQSYAPDRYRLFARHYLSDSKLENGYAANLMETLGAHEGNIVVLEEAYRTPFMRGPAIALSAANVPGVYFVSTDREDSRPFISGVDPNREDGDWDSFAEFLRTLGEDFRLAGGLIAHRDGRFLGCLGDTYEELSKRGLRGKFVGGSCFG